MDSMHKIFQEGLPSSEDKDIAIFWLILLLKENNGELIINSVPNESLLEYGIGFDTTELRPNQPITLKLCKKE